MQCPVCNAKCSENDKACQRCHWEFEIFISVPKTIHLQYSDKTPVPELNRDPFETFEEFADRINHYPPIPAGKVKLIKKDYSFYIGEFPVEIELTKKIRPKYLLKESFYIQVPPDIAQQIYQSNKSHILFIKLKSKKNHSALDSIEIYWNDQVFPIF